MMSRQIPQPAPRPRRAWARALLLTLIKPPLILATLILATPAMARDSLGIFNSWAAFRDSGVPRCYAIAEPAPNQPAPTRSDTAYQPFAAIGTWPKQGIHGALHLRLSHRVATTSAITLSINGPASRRLRLVGGGGDAWPATPQDDAAISAALRSAASMSVTARDTTGRAFTDTYPLSGAATALDAAAIGCAAFK